ncbi:16S rRNA (guanine1516-N2)-methyltransferase [Lachnospiraceae bacterium NK3A20]|nr:16S rRNA (guanine1516-N2)-methyltransferase [Lachnospiraceae bacterium NK3A20]
MRAAESELDKDAGVSLIETPEGLALCGDGMMLREDFRDLWDRVRPGKWEHELLAKAAKRKGRVEGLRAIDCTAGLGEDSLILAAAGFTVELYEQDHVIAALLADAIRRGLEDENLAPIVARMHLHEGDSIAALSAMTPEEAPDVIYLDPMFPQRRKSALIGKKFQLLHHLEAPEQDEETMLEAVIALRPHKIVIKRPLKGPFLAGRKPQYSMKGKAIRYDCIVFANGSSKYTSQTNKINNLKNNVNNITI